MTEMITRTVMVTIEKQVKVSFPAEWGTPENIADWSRGLWKIEGVDCIAKYAAVAAATGGDGCNLDGVGRLGTAYTYFPDGQKPETLFEITDENIESEILPERDA